MRYWVKIKLLTSGFSRCGIGTLLTREVFTKLVEISIGLGLNLSAGVQGCGRVRIRSGGKCSEGENSVLRSTPMHFSVFTAS